MIEKIDRYLFDSAKPVGEGLAYVFNRSPFKLAWPVLLVASILVGIGFGIDGRDGKPLVTVLSAAVGIIIGGMWAWISKKIYNDIRMIKIRIERLTENGDAGLNPEIVDSLAGHFSSSRLIILAIAFLELVLGLVFQDFAHMLVSIAYLIMLLGRYFMWMWDPPGKTLKEHVKSFFTSKTKALVPAVSPNK